MSLISLPFMLLVTASCVLYYLAPKQWRWCILLLANVIFYVAASQALIIFLIGSILSVYIGGLAINKQIKLQKATIKSLEKDLSLIHIYTIIYTYPMAAGKKRYAGCL